MTSTSATKRSTKSISDPTCPKSVSYVSEHLSIMSPVYTGGAGVGALLGRTGAPGAVNISKTVLTIRKLIRRDFESQSNEVVLKRGVKK